MRAVLFLLLMVVSLPAADLAFVQETVSLTPTAGADSVTARFAFSNAGTSPLTITALEASCGCTTVDLEKRLYQPGEKGEIMVTFDLTGLSGAQDKTVQVHHDRGAMILLHFKVVLPEAPTVTPTFLTWKVGEAASAQESVITMAAGVNERAVEVTTSSPDVAGTLARRADGNWTLTVTPVSTASATNVMLKITTDLGHTLRVFASVSP